MELETSATAFAMTAPTSASAAAAFWYDSPGRSCMGVTFKTSWYFGAVLFKISPAAGSTSSPGTVGQSKNNTGCQNQTEYNLRKR